MNLKKIFSLNFDHKKVTGEKLWNQLGEGLPEPVGVLDDDEERVRTFANRCQQLSKKQRQILISWIKKQLEDIERDAPEFICGSYLEWERKTTQIYRHHLEAIENC